MKFPFWVVRLTGNVVATALDIGMKGCDPLINSNLVQQIYYLFNFMRLIKLACLQNLKGIILYQVMNFTRL